MTYRGHVKNGQIALDESIQLPEGAEVNVEAIENGHVVPSEGVPTIWEKLRAIAGTVEGPEDWAENHDHYIQGKSMS